jgi:hypothetical protein
MYHMYVLTARISKFWPQGVLLSFVTFSKRNSVVPLNSTKWLSLLKQKYCASEIVPDIIFKICKTYYLTNWFKVESKPDIEPNYLSAHSRL